MKKQLQTIPSKALDTVAGGIAFPNMGAPEYSAAWWAIMKAAGHLK